MKPLVTLRSIERETVRCKNLVGNLLSFSRMGPIEKESCDLREVIGDALTLVESMCKMQKVDLVKDFQPGLGKMSANLSQVQQMVVNLCSNAIDAMPQGGTLFLRVSKEEISGADTVRIVVQDTGIGMSPEIQAKIFEPFFTTKEVGKGTGLGLSIVYEYVQKHGGTIELESRAGAGTKFTVNLPATANGYCRV